MPTTYIESGTVASETDGASVAPMIEPVAKITAEFAPVITCAAASRTTLDLTRASLAVSSLAVTSSMGTAESRPRTALCCGTMERRDDPINRRQRTRAMHATHIGQTAFVCAIRHCGRRNFDRAGFAHGRQA